MKIHGKTIIVTGGGNSTGQALVVKLLSKSCRVIAVDFNESVLQETVRIVPENEKDRLLVFTVDITDKNSVDEFYEKVIFACGTVDGVINNASILQPSQKLNGLRFKELERLFDINYHGTLYLANAFLPHLLSRPEACIVTSIGSFFPLSPHPGGLSQRISAIKMLTEGLHSELLGTSLNVVNVFPGTAYTDFWVKPYRKGKKDTIPDTSLSPSEEASKIIEGIEQGLSRIYLDKNTGQSALWKNLRLKQKKLHQKYKSFLLKLRNRK